MATFATLSTSLPATLAHAIVYITRPLVNRYPAATLLKLQLSLEANLTAHCARSWAPTDPLRGSGRRCLTFTTTQPPRPVHASCRAANIQWSEWIAALGGLEFDLFIDPGCVSVRFGNWGNGQVGKLITIWSDELDLAAKAAKVLLQEQSRARENASMKTFEQELLQFDEDSEEELFAILADEIRQPTWLTPVFGSFPKIVSPPKSTSPVSATSNHSRSSSRSSNSSSGLTFSSVDTSSEYASSVTTISSVSTEKSQLSRRERARQARIFVDSSKNEVTNYDGGKTTVLTGGVMLGAPARMKPVAPPTPSGTNSASVAKPRVGHGPSSSSNWRSLRC